MKDFINTVGSCLQGFVDLDFYVKVMFSKIWKLSNFGEIVKKKKKKITFEENNFEDYKSLALMDLFNKLRITTDMIFF